MAYRAEKNGQTVDIVIDGFEDGIADSPYKGLADIRNANVTSSPGEAMVNFATAGLTLPPNQSNISFNGNAATDVLTLVSGTTAGYYASMAIIVNTTAGGLTSGTVYYMGSITSTTFKLYADPALTSLIDITSTITGSTFSIVQLGAASYWTQDQGTKYIFFVDTSGRAWYISNGNFSIAVNTVVYLGNLTLGGGQGICAFFGYLFVFRSTTIDYANINNLLAGSSPFIQWHYGWSAVGTPLIDYTHQVISATDNAMYFCNGSGVGSVLQKAGTNFDPASSSTYTFNNVALALPNFDRATFLSQLGTNLLVGGIQNYVYPWNRTSPSFNYPLIIGENSTARIVSTNSSAYIFAGNRGNIYITNGVNIQLYKKVPDFLSGTENPYYTWGTSYLSAATVGAGDAIYLRNFIYFTLVAYDNAGNALNNLGAVFAIDTNTKALTIANQLSYGSYNGTITALIPNIVTSGSFTLSPGLSYFAAWSSGGSFGVDVSSSTPYTNYQTYIDSDFIPVGTFAQSRTFQQVEFKLSKPLVAGESVRVSQRSNLTDAFTVIGTTTTTGAISDMYPVNWQTVQWLQLRAELSSIASSPSYTRLTQIRIR